MTRARNTQQCRPWPRRPSPNPTTHARRRRPSCGDHRAQREEVERAKQEVSLKDLEIEVAQAEPPRNFFAAVTNRRAKGTTAVIAEIKRAQPQRGVDPP